MRIFPARVEEHQSPGDMALNVVSHSGRHLGGFLHIPQLSEGFLMGPQARFKCSFKRFPIKGTSAHGRAI